MIDEQTHAAAVKAAFYEAKGWTGQPGAGNTTEAMEREWQASDARRQLERSSAPDVVTIPRSVAIDCETVIRWAPLGLPATDDPQIIEVHEALDRLERAMPLVPDSIDLSDERTTPEPDHPE